MPDRLRALAALEALSRATSPDSQYAAIRQSFLIDLSENAQAFLDGGNRRGTVNAERRAIVESYGRVAELLGPLAGDDLAFFNAEVQAELDYVESFWADLATQRKAGDTTLPAARIELYARSLDALYNELRARAAKNQMLEFDGDDGQESCATCQKLKGQQHRAKWWIGKGLIPAQPGNANFECKGFMCQHFLRDVVTGAPFTVGA